MISFPRYGVALALGFAALAANAGPFTNIFVFGDSLSDTGNVSIVTGGAVPGVPYYQGRASNGPLYIDVLAAGLGLSLVPSRRDLNGDGSGDGNNFAYGGARTNSYPFPFDGRSLLGQLNEFTMRMPVADPGALYVVFAGANNIQDALGAAAMGAPMSVVTGLITQGVADIATVLSELAARGADNFLIPNLPNVALVPRIRELGNPSLSALGSLLGMSFNAGVDGFLTGFGVDHDVFRLDVFSLFNEAVANPSAFGLTNVVNRCYTGDDIRFTGGPPPCPNPDQYLFWDGIHPTATIHATLGQFALRTIAEPSSSLLIALALVVAFGSRRRSVAHALV